MSDDPKNPLDLLILCGLTIPWVHGSPEHLDRSQHQVRPAYCVLRPLFVKSGLCDARARQKARCRGRQCQRITGLLEHSLEILFFALELEDCVVGGVVKETAMLAGSIRGPERLLGRRLGLNSTDRVECLGVSRRARSMNSPLDDASVPPFSCVSLARRAFRASHSFLFGGAVVSQCGKACSLMGPRDPSRDILARSSRIWRCVICKSFRFLRQGMSLNLRFLCLSLSFIICAHPMNKDRCQRGDHRLHTIQEGRPVTSNRALCLSLSGRRWTL